MLHPRSFLFTRSTKPTPSEIKHEQRSKHHRRWPTAEKQDMSPPAPSSPEPLSRPATPTSPVIIPSRGKHDTSHDTHRTLQQTRKERRNGRTLSRQVEGRTRSVHSPDALPPSVAALLAITAIPPQRSNNASRLRSGASQQLTMDAILQHTNVSEKEYSSCLGRSQLDYLLSPPEDLDDEMQESENGQESVTSTRTMSSESIPSLDNESINEMSPPYGSITTPNSRGRKSMPARRMQSISSSVEHMGKPHPLEPDIEVEELDFRVFQRPQDSSVSEGLAEIALPRQKSAFKSNLTASLRALRSAAMSFSSLTTPMITPDDFLTRSIISIDPQIPFTDERMPPRLEDTPTAALRRYLNPTSNAPIEPHRSSSLTQTMSPTPCTASIQMQTYKVSRSTKSASLSVISRRTKSSSEEAIAEVTTGPVARQRDMRENSDFIRIAVMEMAMRKNGKLDDQKPGRARWALPPRKPPTKPYEISPDGIPTRWLSVTE